MGKCSQVRELRRAPHLHKRSAEDWEEAALTNLDGTEMSLLSPIETVRKSNPGRAL